MVKGGRMMEEIKWAIVDKKTGKFLVSKLYTHKGTAQNVLNRGGFYLRDTHEPMVVGLNTALGLALTKAQLIPIEITCDNEDCDKPVTAKGLCMNHYKKERRRINGRN
jgi:hypothetical protein